MNMHERIKSGEFEAPMEMPKKPKKPQRLREIRRYYDPWGKTDSLEDFNAAQKEIQDYELAIVKWRELRDKWVALDNEACERFKTAALEDVGLTNHPKAEKIWLKAWGDGIGSYTEIYRELLELAEILL